MSSNQDKSYYARNNTGWHERDHDKEKLPLWAHGSLHPKPASVERMFREASRPGSFVYDTSARSQSTSESGEASVPQPFHYSSSDNQDPSHANSQYSADEYHTDPRYLGFQSTGGYTTGQHLTSQDHLIEEMTHQSQFQYLSPDPATQNYYPQSIHLSSGSNSRASPASSCYGGHTETRDDYTQPGASSPSSDVPDYRSSAYASSSRQPQYGQADYGQYYPPDDAYADTSSTSSHHRRDKRGGRTARR